MLGDTRNGSGHPHRNSAMDPIVDTLPASDDSQSTPPSDGSVYHASTPPHSFSPGQAPSSAFSTPTQSSLGDKVSTEEQDHQDGMVAMFLSSKSGQAVTNDVFGLQLPSNTAMGSQSPERTRYEVEPVSPERSLPLENDSDVVTNTYVRQYMIEPTSNNAMELKAITQQMEMEAASDPSPVPAMQVNNSPPKPVAVLDDTPRVSNNSKKNRADNEPVVYSMSTHINQALGKLKDLAEPFLSDEAIVQGRGAQTPHPTENNSVSVSDASQSQYDDLDKLYSSDRESDVSQTADKLDISELVKEIRHGKEEEKKDDEDVPLSAAALSNSTGTEPPLFNEHTFASDSAVHKSIPVTNTVSPDRSSSQKSSLTRKERMARITERQGIGAKILNSLTSSSKSSPYRSNASGNNAANANNNDDDDDLGHPGLMGPPPIARETQGSMTPIMRLRTSPEYRNMMSPKSGAPTPVVTNTSHTTVTADAVPLQPEIVADTQTEEDVMKAGKQRSWRKNLDDKKRQEELRQLTGGRQYPEDAQSAAPSRKSSQFAAPSRKSSLNDYASRRSRKNRHKKRGRSRRGKSMDDDNRSMAGVNCNGGIRRWLQQVIDGRCGDVNDTYSIYDEGEESSYESASMYDQESYSDETVTKGSSGENESKGLSTLENTTGFSTGYSLDRSNAFSLDESSPPRRTPRYSSDGSRSSHRRSVESSVLEYSQRDSSSSSRQRGRESSVSSRTRDRSLQPRRSRVSKSPGRTKNSLYESPRQRKDSPDRNFRSFSKERSNVRENPEDDVGVQDKNFIHVFISGATTRGIILLLHKKQRIPSLSRPQKVLVFLKMGAEKQDGTFIGPSLTWNSKDGSESGHVGLFDVRAIDKASARELEDYPLAMPGRSLIVRTGSGSNLVFEANNEGAAVRFCHGMKWVVARLTFNLIIGNVNVSCELLDIGEPQEDYDGQYRKFPKTPVEESQWTMAMNGLTNHLVDKAGS